MDWKDPDMFERAEHGNKPFAIRVPALVVSRGAGDRINFLTAMWFTPAGFEPSRLVVSILKRTLTYRLMLERGEFVMSAPSDKMMEVVVFAGYMSGNDVDKWKATGLTPVKPSKVSVPLIGEAIGNVEYRVIQQIPFDDKTISSWARHWRLTLKKGQWKASCTAVIPIPSYTWGPSMTPRVNRWASSTLTSAKSNAPIMSLRC